MKISSRGANLWTWLAVSPPWTRPTSKFWTQPLIPSWKGVTFQSRTLTWMTSQSNKIVALQLPRFLQTVAKSISNWRSQHHLFVRKWRVRWSKSNRWETAWLCQRFSRYCHPTSTISIPLQSTWLESGTSMLDSASASMVPKNSTKECSLRVTGAQS